MKVLLSVGSVKVYGGSGASFEDPIVIVAKTSTEGVPVEYKFLAHKYGQREADWTFNNQSLQRNDGVPFDVINITTKNPKKTFDVYFDISAFFGKY